MGEGTPYFSPDETQEFSRDTESDMNRKKAEKLAEIMQKIRRIEAGIETEMDENVRSVKASFQAISFTLGTQAVSLTDDDDDQ